MPSTKAGYVATKDGDTLVDCGVPQHGAVRAARSGSGRAGTGSGARIGPHEGAGGSELDVGLDEQPALEQLGVDRLEFLLERHHDAQPSASHLAPVRAAEDVAAPLVAVVRRVRIEEVQAADAGPAGETLPAFAEERQAAALDVHGDERVVGGGQILRRADDMGLS